MVCITPLTLKQGHNSKLSRTNIVPCGKCHKCKRARQNDWVFRLEQEQKNSVSSCFATLTYENPPLSFNGHQTLEPNDLKLFWKRLRKYISVYHSEYPSLKYYAVGEYGTKFLRPHYHAIIYNLPHKLIQNNEKFTKIWGSGYCDIAGASGASMRYTCGYIMQSTWEPSQDDDDRSPQFSRMSQGLGRDYITDATLRYHKENLLPVVTKPGGIIQRLPRYLKEKIFTKPELAIMRSEAQRINELNLNEYLSYDYRAEIIQKTDGIRRFKKELALNKKANF